MDNEYILIAYFDNPDKDKLERYINISEDRNLLNDEMECIEKEPDLYSSHELVEVKVYKLIEHIVF